MQNMMPYHQSFFGQPLKVFDPFSLYFWDNFPHDFPAFRAPPMMIPPRPVLPNMGRLVPRTKIEYKETPEAHHFQAELPGMRKEDVVVKLEDGGKMLNVSAKKRHEKQDNRECYHHMERSYGEFVSRFSLPPNCKAEHLRSCVDNGVLTITIPKEKVHNYQHNY